MAVLRGGKEPGSIEEQREGRWGEKAGGEAGKADLS